MSIEGFEDLDNALDALVTNLDIQLQIQNNQQIDYTQTDPSDYSTQNPEETYFNNGDEGDFNFQDADSQLDEIVEEFEHELQSNDVSIQTQPQEPTEQTNAQSANLNVSMPYTKPLPTPKPKPLPTPKPREQPNPQQKQAAKVASNPSKVSNQPVKTIQKTASPGPSKTAVRPPIKVAHQERKPVVPPTKANPPQKNTSNPQTTPPSSSSPQTTMRNSSQDDIPSNSNSANSSFNTDIMSRPVPQKCSRCVTSSAVLKCDECESIFCLNCSEDLHIGKWRNHTHHAIEDNKWGKSPVNATKQRSAQIGRVRSEKLSTEDIQAAFAEEAAITGSTAPPVKVVKTNSISELKSKIGNNINLGGKPSSGPISALKKEVSLRTSFGQYPSKKENTSFIVILLTVVDRNISMEKQFTTYTHIKNILQLGLKQLLNIPYPDKKEKDKEYYAIYFSGVWLDPERNLQSYGINNKVNLEIRLRKHEPILVKALIPDANATYVTVRVDETTSVWSVQQQILKKLYNRGVWTLPAPADQYALFFSDDKEPFDDGESLFTYKEKLGDKIVFKVKSTPQEIADTKFTILYSEEIHADLVLPGTFTVDKIIRNFIKTHVMKGQSTTQFTPSDYALEIPPNEEDEESVWLVPSQQIAMYNPLFLLFGKRARNYSFLMPDGSEQTLAIDSASIIRDCLRTIVFNFPDFVNNLPLNEFVLTTKDGIPLSDDQNVWQIATEGDNFFFKRKLYPLVVFFGEYGQKTLQVDYSMSVHKVMDLIWKAFSVTPKKDSEFSLRRLSPDVSIDLNKSLAAQAIAYNSTVLVKLLGVEKSAETQVTVNDINIWEEPNVGTIMLDSDNRTPRAATFNKLVEYLTSERNNDVEYMRAFLLTYSAFATPSQLLSKLIERYYVPIPPVIINNEDMENFRKNTVKVIQLRVCTVMKSWLETQWQDFDHELTQQVVNFVDNLPPEYNVLAHGLRQAILKRTCGFKTRTPNNFIGKLHQCPEPILRVKKVENTATQLFDFDELEIARQFTLVEFEYYQKVLPTEFLAQSWSKPSLQHNAQNILSWIGKSNEVSLYVAGLIVDPVRAKIRASRFTKLIKVAEHLASFNNYATLMAFLGGFNNSAVTRLKFTKALMPKRSLDTLVELERLMSVDGSYKSYRDAMRTLNPPLIPYLGTHLSDLTFIDDGNPNTVNGLINFSKYMLSYKQINEIMRYQGIEYRLKPVHAIAKFIREIPSREEKSYNQLLYEMSLSREPRGAEKVL